MMMSSVVEAVKELSRDVKEVLEKEKKREEERMDWVGGNAAASILGVGREL